MSSVERSHRRVTKQGRRPSWWLPLMGVLDPQRDAWGLIQEGEDRYHQGRTGDDVGSRPSEEGSPR